MQSYLLAIILFLFSNILFSQTEDNLLRETLQNYIDGTSYDQPEIIKKAFYNEANLYLSHKEKDVWIVPVSEYANWFKKGTPNQFNGRIGNIVSIDHYNDIAVAKVEIILPSKGIEFMDMFLLKKIKNNWKVISKTASSKKSNQSGDRILFIVSNAHYHGSSDIATGNSFSEIVNAFDTFTNEGYTVDFVSPDGGSIPLAYINTSDSLHKKYIYTTDFMYALKHTKKPSDIDPQNYKAVHYIGGGSAMYGVPENKEIQKLSMTIFEKYGGIISSVCHGTAGIVNLKTKDGKYLVNGNTISGYPDSFEKQDADYFKQFPFKIQETIEKRGGTFRFSSRNSMHVEVEGNLITGQNYLSSKHVALKIIERLRNQ
ncbi:nuclear transport factor 2 family protein [Aquimarina aquimarini]|uniref:nuclear transport factor 2 family protein n=1 Tax=Aquimarina aquimarini TaxID=1191734 RepID=UPI001F444A27|nr:nuclear transport factor 2 family protein [Aquimarina aquimarini]